LGKAKKNLEASAISLYYRYITHCCGFNFYSFSLIVHLYFIIIYFISISMV
jgi:hypothetical protein